MFNPERGSPVRSDKNDLIDEVKVEGLMLGLQEQLNSDPDLKSDNARKLINELLILVEPMVGATAEVFVKRYPRFVMNRKLEASDMEQELRKTLLLPGTYRTFGPGSPAKFLITVFHRVLLAKYIDPEFAKKRDGFTVNLEDSFFYKKQADSIDRGAEASFEAFENDEALKEISKIVVKLPDPINGLMFILAYGLGKDVYDHWHMLHQEKLNEWNKKPAKLGKRNFSHIDEHVFADIALSLGRDNEVLSRTHTYVEIGEIIGCSRETVRLRLETVIAKLKRKLNVD